MLAPEAFSASVSFLWTLSRVVLSCRPRNLPLSVCPAVTSPDIFRTASSAFMPVWFFSNTMKHLDQEISNPLLLLFPIVRTHFVFEKSKNGVHAGWLCATFGASVWIRMSISVCSPALRSVCYWQTGSSALLANTVLIPAHRLCQPFALLVTFQVLPCPKQIVESECLLPHPHLFVCIKLFLF